MQRALATCLGVATFLVSVPAVQAAPGDVVIPPDWQRKPDGDYLVRVYPVAAREAGIVGKVRLGCNVSIEGQLEQCQVLLQKPPGWGFGVAALAMAKSFSWRPETVNGVAVGGVPVVVPFDFGASSGEYGAVTIMEFDSPATTPRLVDPIWSQTPTRAQVESVFPPEDLDKIDLGYVVLRCRMKPDGFLTHCDALTARPEAREFKLAALKLADDFKLSVADYEPRVLKQVSVEIPVTFAPPGAAHPKLDAPQWTHTLDAANLTAVFPDAARAAGVLRGGGVVKCHVTHEGRFGQLPVSQRDACGPRVRRSRA